MTDERLTNLVMISNESEIGKTSDMAELTETRLFLRCFIWIENCVPRINENYNLVPMQVHTGYLTFSLKNLQKHLHFLKL